MAVIQAKHVLQLQKLFIQKICEPLAKKIIASSKRIAQFAVSIGFFKSVNQKLIAFLLQTLNAQQFLIHTIFADMAKTFIHTCKDLYFKSKPRAIAFWHRVKAYSKKQWKKWEPRINKVLQISVGITSATSTLKLTIDILPIILMMLTVLSTLPLFGIILPQWLFEPMIMLPIMAGISCYVGYRKYREEVKRAKLDRQILASKIQIKKLTKQMTHMQKSLNHYKTMLLYQKRGPQWPLRQQTRQAKQKRPLRRHKGL